MWSYWKQCNRCSHNYDPISNNMHDLNILLLLLIAQIPFQLPPLLPLTKWKSISEWVTCKTVNIKVSMNSQTHLYERQNMTQANAWRLCYNELVKLYGALFPTRAANQRLQHVQVHKLLLVPTHCIPSH